MATNEDLARLFTELKSASSPLRRMKLLGRAWRTLRQLSPKARKDLAAQVGIDGAEDVIERLAGEKGGLTPTLLLSALESLRGTDPQELRRAMAGLKDPAGRRALLERGVEVVGSALDEPEPAAAAKVEATTPKPRAAAVSAVVSAAAAAPAAQAAPYRPPVVVAQATAPRPTPDARAAFPRPLPPPPAPAAPAPPRTGDASLVDRVAAAPRLTDKFRVLREHVDDARNLSLEDLRRLIETFPPQWARRRALAALFDRQIPPDLHRAIYLVELLDSRASQRYCVARILHTWPLADHERQALLERRGSFIHRAR